ncbi:HAD family phosphatase [Schaalia sp. Marseille-Q2122]|uniref:HAD family hydrolase n=1 Tax=Schaalia sp. Marseille-Q2122 TaxID=2736604 RepID=UPI00158CFFEF|nr:HAD family phosphatase [Schaalia sp. Marseille-Q2122]
MTSVLPAAILLDQDGTIIDSEPIWDEVEFDLTRELGGTLTPEIRETFIGGPLSVTARTIIELTGTAVSQEEIEHEIVERVASTIEERGVRWLPGVADFLARMRSAGLPIAVVTASYHRIADAVMADAPVEGITLMVAGDDVEHPKPDPAGYRLAAERLGVDPQRCVAVEDSFPGMCAAVGAGARTIMVPGMQRVELAEGVSRVNALADIDLELLARVMSGECVDLARVPA